MDLNKCHGVWQGNVGGRKLAGNLRRRWMLMEKQIRPQWSRLAVAPLGKKAWQMPVSVRGDCHRFAAPEGSLGQEHG